MKICCISQVLIAQILHVSCRFSIVTERSRLKGMSYFMIPAHSIEKHKPQELLLAPPLESSHSAWQELDTVQEVDVMCHLLLAFKHHPSMV